MAAPAVVRGAGAAAKGAGAAKAGGAAKAAGSGTAAGRASELRAGGTRRRDARKALREEFGGSVAETDALLDDAGLTDDAPAGAGGQQPRRATPSLPSVPRTVQGAVDAGGGALLGALAYVLALAYMRGGKDGVKAWLNAKFLNQTSERRPK